MRNPENCHEFHKLLQRRILQNHMYIMHCSTPGNFRTSLQCNNCHVGSTKNPKNLSVKEYFRWLLEMVYHRGSYIKFREHVFLICTKLAVEASGGGPQLWRLVVPCCTHYRHYRRLALQRFQGRMSSNKLSVPSQPPIQGHYKSILIWDHPADGKFLSIFGKCQRISKKSREREIYIYICIYMYIDNLTSKYIRNILRTHCLWGKCWAGKPKIQGPELLLLNSNFLEDDFATKNDIMV